MAGRGARIAKTWKTTMTFAFYVVCCILYAVGLFDFEQHLTLSTMIEVPSSLQRIIPSSANSFRSIIVQSFFKNAGIGISRTRTSSSDGTLAEGG